MFGIYVLLFQILYFNNNQQRNKNDLLNKNTFKYLLPKVMVQGQPVIDHLKTSKITEAYYFSKVV